MGDVNEFITAFDLHLFNEGRNFRSYEKLGAHLFKRNGVAGVHFAVWAPNAQEVSVIGDFNNYNWAANRLSPLGSSGLWAGFVAGAGCGMTYKYGVKSRFNGFAQEKSDPFAFAFELRPKSASVVWDLGGYDWSDAAWMKERGKSNSLGAPMSIYEIHLGSWKRTEDNRWLNYREMAEELPAYARDMGFTHVELLPVTEHPFDGSWGYQTIGYFAPTSRFGTPQDFMRLVDRLHQAGIGVILDWVPAHFPRDAHGLGFFDGTHLYEHSDARQGEQKDWGTLVFNFGRLEVQDFLISSALFWLDKYHIDGLRVDAVASMLYLDYSRKDGEWLPNKFGGRENLEAIDFIKRFNETVYKEYPDSITFAEESTSWPGVSRPTYLGGLGFGMKWNMGWMHDMLDYMVKDPLFRGFHHNRLTFGMLYAHHENFVLPFSHDEVVHMKGSMLSKMPGDPWRRFANLRLLYGYMYGYQGKKLLFMGNEFGQGEEWNHDKGLDWSLLNFPFQRGLQNWVRDLNKMMCEEPALHEMDFDPSGFRWIDCNDSAQSVVSFFRRAKNFRNMVACVCNFTPVPRREYRIGVPRDGAWREILNSDAETYGGGNIGNQGRVMAEPKPWHNLSHSLCLTVPPLGALFLKPEE